MALLDGEEVRPQAPSRIGDVPPAVPVNMAPKRDKSWLEMAWLSLPPEVRKQWTSLAQFSSDMSTGASIRDAVDEYKEMNRAAWQGEGWKAAGHGAGLLTAMAGTVLGKPTVKAIKEGTKEAAKVIGL